MTAGKGPQGIFFAVWLGEAVIRIRPCRRCMTETITTNAFNDVPDNERRERNSQLRSHLTFPSDRIDSATTLGDVCVCWELIIYSQTHRCSSQTSANSGSREGSCVAPVLLSRGVTNSSFLLLLLKALKMILLCTYFHQLFSAEGAVMSLKNVKHLRTNLYICLNKRLKNKQTLKY